MGHDGEVITPRVAGSRRTVDEHAAAVAALLAECGLDPADPVRLGAEVLALTDAELMRDPARWLGRILAAVPAVPTVPTVQTSTAAPAQPAAPAAPGAPGAPPTPPISPAPPAPPAPPQPGDIRATAPLPRFDNSQMDGYAVRSADLAGATPANPVSLRVRDAIVAGETGAGIGPGDAAPIMTGAPVPPGADAIVPIEQAVPPRFGASDRVAFTAPVAAGTFVRTAGSDVAPGEVLLRAGDPLTAPALGILAFSGATHVALRRRPRVLLTITGHEVRPPGTDLAPGQIHDANSFSLWLALTEAGAEVVVVPCPSDEPAELRGILDRHVAEADLVLTVGGVSAGAREVVREVLEPEGVWFASVAMQPGGPQGLGTIEGGAGGRTPVLCFPGNPVSCLVSFEVFLRPLLRALATGSRTPIPRPRSVLPLAESWDSPPGTHQVRRGRVDADGRVRAVGGASSHLLHAYARSTVLVHVPADAVHLEAGDLVETWRIDGRD